MAWKNSPYWMKGGIIFMLSAFLIGVILGLFMIFLNFIGSEDFLFFYGLSLTRIGTIIYFLFGAGYTAVLLFTPQFEDIFPLGTIVFGAISLIIWFIVGSLIGPRLWKNKKEKPHRTPKTK